MVGRCSSRFESHGVNSSMPAGSGLTKKRVRNLHDAPASGWRGMEMELTGWFCGVSQGQRSEGSLFEKSAGGGGAGGDKECRLG